MEPCTHYGATPPCTNLIIKKKLKEFFYTFDDWDLRTRRKAKTRLNERKIKVLKVLIINLRDSIKVIFQ